MVFYLFLMPSVSQKLLGQDYRILFLMGSTISTTLNFDLHSHFFEGKAVKLLQRLCEACNVAGRGHSSHQSNFHNTVCFVIMWLHSCTHDSCFSNWSYGQLRMA